MIVELILWAAVVPASVTALLMGGMLWRYRDVDAARPVAAVAPLALFAGFAAAWIGALGVPEWLPTDASDWPFIAGLVAALVGVGFATSAGTSPIRWLTRILLSGAVATALTYNLAKHAWSTTEAVSYILLVTAVITALWTTTRAVGESVSSPALLGTFIALAAGGAGVIVLASSVKLGQLSGSLAAACGGAALLATVVRGRLDVRGMVPVVAVVVGSLWSLAFLLAELPLGALLLLPLAPLSTLILARRPDRGSVASALAGALLTLPLLGVAAGWTYAVDPSRLGSDSGENPSGGQSDDGYDDDYGYD